MSKPSRPVILDDVARLSGVSRAAASRALAGKPGVADDVRERIQTIAKALDYRPNRAAKNLAGAKTSLLALLLGDTDFYHNPYSSRLVDAIAKATDHFDQGLMLVVSEHEPGRAVNNLIHDRIVDGVVLSPVTFGKPWAEQLIDSDMTTVLIGEHPHRSDVSSVRVENKLSAERLVGHLIDTGCTRVGMILGPDGRRDAQDRHTGYVAAHDARGIAVDPQLSMPGRFDRATGYQRAQELLDLGVDAIFAANDLSAYGALAACDERGLNVPDHVSVVGFDGASERWSKHDLTTVIQPFDALARRAVQMLIEPAIDNCAIHGELYFGDTTRVAVA